MPHGNFDRLGSKAASPAVAPEPSIRVRSTSACGHAGDLLRHGPWVPIRDL